jgi:hypothetical protein
MSIELLLYCKSSPSKSAIERVILPLGFRAEETLGKGYHFYYWFEEKDLASVRGCWLDWHKREPDEEAPRGTKTVFVAKTYMSRSHEDLDMQNRLIRELRRRFGGSVYNDDEGTYAYLKNDIPRLSYSEKRCGFVYHNIRKSIDRIRMLVCDVPEGTTAVLTDGDRVLFANDAIMQNNVLLPFLVSLLESFLRDFFIAFIDSHPDLLERIYERQGKLEYTAMRDILKGKVTLAEHEANSHSFQNLESANVAFQQYMGINLFKVWGKRKKFNDKLFVVRVVLQELLSLRHRIIHEAYIERNLDEEETIKYIQFVEYALVLLASHLEQQNNFRIDLERYL